MLLSVFILIGLDSEIVSYRVRQEVTFKAPGS